MGMTAASMNTSELQNIRKKIDILDEELLRIFAERFLKVKEIRMVKKATGLAPLDETRWKNVVDSRLAQAKALGLPEEFTKSFEHSRAITR